MNRTNIYFQQLGTRAAGVLFSMLLLALGACGGGGGQVAGVGTGGSGLAQGTISGFGSVIVAGVERLQMLAEAGSRTHLQRLLRDWLPQLQQLKLRHKGLLRWAVDVDPLAI